MAAKKDHLLMIALGKGKKGPPPADDEDDGLEYGAEDDEPEEGEPDDEDYSEDDSIECAHDLMDALDKGDAAGVVEAIKAIAGK